MKKLLSLIAVLSLGLSACSSTIDVATPEEQKEHKEARGIMESWQALVDASESADCEAFMSYARKDIGMEAAQCEAAFEFVLDIPGVDWSRTQWDAHKGKGKIYEQDRGSIVSFIYNGADDAWRFDSHFWN